MKKVPTTTPKYKTYIALVLDSSGSMCIAKNETISGYNEQIQQIKEDAAINKDNESLISLITFNGRVSVNYSHKSVNKAKELTDTTYKPGGATALFDAVDTAIELINSQSDIENQDNAALVVVFTDGNENSSKRINAVELSKKIKSLEDKGNWTFTFMGAKGFDLEKLAEGIGINKGNTMTFNAQDSKGYLDGLQEVKKGITTYLSSRACGQTQTQSFYTVTTDNTKDED